MYATHFTVSGASTFPLDMLRYDACFPNTSDDARDIGLPHGAESREIRLITYHYAKATHPTVGRWESFGWHIVETNCPIEC